MVERNTDIQYDDDLTVGADDYDESLYDGDVDLFEYVGEDETAITRLKTIVLSIDWEITDDILRELNEELRELKDIWYKERINLVYVQALDKLSKYIYQERADANPNSIKLLLTFYANLEKIVLEDDLTEDEKTNILLEDVKRFEKFKEQIGVSKKKSQELQTGSIVEGQKEETIPADVTESEKPTVSLTDSEDVLLNLKAIVYGIDWEITDRELSKLKDEVEILKGKLSSSKVKILFLQGIGTLGDYISAKRSDSHGDAFQLLHSFFAGLERVVKEDLSYAEEKRILMEKVEFFNAFKATIASTISPGELDVPSKKDADVSIEEPPQDEILAPALSDFGDEISPATEEQKSRAEEVEEVDSKISGATDDDITDEMKSRLESFFGDEFDQFGDEELSDELALQGVAVETEADDDEDEEALPRHGDILAPALSDDEDHAFFGEEAESIAEKDEETQVSSQVSGFFDDEGVDTKDSGDEVEKEDILETDQDVSPALGFLNDKEEIEEQEPDIEPPSEIEGRLDSFFDDEEVAPALAESLDVSDETAAPVGVEEEEPPSEIMEKLEGFFEDEKVSHVSEDGVLALQGVDVETEADDDSEEAPLLFEDGEVAPALEDESVVVDQLDSDEEVISEEPSLEMKDKIDSFFEDAPGVSITDIEEEPLQGLDVETEADDDSDEEPLPFEDGEVAPALGDAEIVIDEGITEESFALEGFDDEVGGKTAGITEAPPSSIVAEVEEEVTGSDITAEEQLDEGQSEEIQDRLESFFEENKDLLLSEDSELALEGVAVETEADDDSDEEPLPIKEGMVAPALQVEDTDIEVSHDFESAAPEGGEALVDFDEESEDDQTLVGIAAPSVEDESFALSESLIDEVDETSYALSDDIEVEKDEKVIFEEVTEEPEVIFEAVEEESEQEKSLEFSVVEADEEMLGVVGATADEDFFTSEELLVDDEEVVFEPVDDETTSQVKFEEALESDIIGLEEEELDKILDEGITETDEKGFVERLGLPEEEPVLEEGWLDEELADPLSDLRDSVLAVDKIIDDVAIQKLFDEVARLELKWNNNPLGKNFLLLMPPLVQHLDRYRDVSDRKPNDLLLSVLEGLEHVTSGDADQAKIQSTLLEETSKVFLWQQGIIENLISDVAEDTDLPGEPIKESSTLIADKDKSDKQIADKVTQEIGEMRKAFKEEMEALRKELRDEIRKR